MSDESARVRNPEGTKQAVLDAAERLFAERGYEGTSIRDLGVACGVSHPLIQHHFGSKDCLYDAVLSRCTEDFETRFPELVNGPDRPIDVAEEVHRLFGFLKERERLVRMVGWARLEGRLNRIKLGQGPRQAMIRRIEAAQRAGLVRSDLDASTIGVLIESVVFYWVENRDLNARLFNTLPDDQTYVENAIAVLRRGLQPE